MVGDINIDPAVPHAFLSYTRFDDNYLSGGISALRLALEQAVRARTGESFRIFQDVDDIKPGDPWRKKLDEAIQAAQLFIPVLTPNFFTSDFCRREAKAFLDYEARAGRNDLVLPIYLIDTPRLDDDAPRATDDLARQLHDRQYADWRAHQFLLQAAETRAHIHELAGAISSAIVRTNAIEQGPVVPTTGAEEQIAKLKREIAELNEALTVEQERTRLLAVELGERQGEVKQFAEDAAAFKGQLEEALASQDESEATRKLRERLSLLDQALKKERGKTKTLTKDLEASEDKVEQLTIERTVLEGDVHEAKVHSQRIQRLERRLQQKEDELAKTAEAANADRETLLGEMALLKDELKTSKSDGKRQKTSRVGLDGLTSSLANLRENFNKVSSSVEARKLAKQVGIALLGLLAIGGSLWIYSNIAAHSAGTVFKDCDECPEMVIIPAGEFLMGSPEGQGKEDEHPQHKVIIGKPFALGRYEVTFKEWDACAKANGCRRRPYDEGWGRGDRPVINVSWNDAQEYAEWLAKTTGKDYRLPSETEWEHAARSGSTTNYHWGHSIGRNKANCSFNYCGEVFDKTAPVGSFPANDFGLFDVLGNVWEWVEDAWHGNYENAPLDQSSWGAKGILTRVKRGGAWSSSPSLLRSANRDWGSLGVPGRATGFRVAMTL